MRKAPPITMTFRALMIAAACAIGAACGGQGDSARETAKEREAARDVVAGSQRDLPEGFPDDIPLNPDLNIVTAIPAPGGGFMIQAVSEGTADAIAADIESRMTSAGWRLAGDDQATAQMRRLGFNKDARATSYVILANNDDHLVQIVTMAKPD